MIESAGSAPIGPGRLTWDSTGRVMVLASDGRPAAAGDGVASAIASLLAQHDAASATWSTQVHVPLELLEGTERPVGEGVDMTNWNVVVDDAVIVKVTGKLGDADRAVRLVRAVARHEPDAVPTLHGTLELRAGAAPTAPRVTVATVTSLMRGAVDGWTWVVDEAQNHLDGGARSDWPHRVGSLLARVHVALWRETADSRRPADDDLLHSAALHDVEHLARGRSPLAQRLAARLEHVTAAICALPAVTAPRFALHGDLHVGQLLRDAHSHVKLIDFDGDPQSPSAADSADAAVDMAHLLVSIDLVGAIVAKRRRYDDPRILEWSTETQDALLSAYRAEAGRLGADGLLDQERLPGLRAMQLVRELTYARDYLPRWSYAPDWAITHRYPPHPDAEDPVWTPPDSPTT